MSATAGVQILLNPAAVSQQAHAIPAIESDLGQGKRGVDGVVQFRKSRSVARLPASRPKQAAAIAYQRAGAAGGPLPSNSGAGAALRLWRACVRTGTSGFVFSPPFRSSTPALPGTPRQGLFSQVR